MMKRKSPRPVQPNEGMCEGGHSTAPRPAPAPLRQAAEIFRAMGDADRLRLLEVLRHGEMCVSEIVAAVGDKFSTISQRLRILRDEGLVERRRDGTHLYYRLTDQHVLDLIDNALAHAAESGAISMRQPRKE